MAPAPGELLFFDTFSHEMVELNLDLVQFPRPVFVEEVRVIPLGARVEANFPGGVRLGATNPTQFKLECFVNNLRNPGAATFETVGTLNFKHDHEIHLHMEKVIPTDGLVLRGMYNAITLAVYGTLSNSTAEQFALEAANAAAAASAAALAAEAAAAAVAALPVVESGTGESRSSVLMNGKGGRRSSRSPTSSSDNGLGIKIQDSPSSKYSTPPPAQDNRHSPVSSSHPERVVPILKDDILDNVSDISDGDIPDLNDDEPMEPDDEPEKTSIETAAPVGTDAVAKPAADEDASGTVLPDDELMEAISDDEAEWSDEDMTDYDFGDWDDPVKIHDCFSVELCDKKAFATSIAVSDLDSFSLKVSQLGDMILDQKWIDHLDSLVLALEPWKHRVDLPEELSDKVCVIALDCVSLDKAQSHSLPAATIRHLKSGLKFVKKLFTLSSHCVQVLVEERHIHEHLRTILSSGNVSTSIKYRALDLMDITLDWAIKEPQRTSLYEFCLSQCECSSLRLKPVYVRLLKRYNLKESLQKLRILTMAMTSSGDDGALSGDAVVSDLLQTIWKFFRELFFHRAQEQIQTVGYPGSNEDPPLDQMQLCCQSEQFLQCLVVLLSDPASSNLVLDYCFQILDQLVNSLPGLFYLSSEKQAVRQLTKLLLGGESVNECGMGSDDLGRLEESQISLLGQRIAFGTYGLQQSLKLVSNRDPRDILETIQNLHALTFSNEGLLALVKVLCLQEDLQLVLVNLVQLQESEEDVEQGAIKGYAMDLLIMLFRYSDDIGSMRGITNNINWISEEDWISEENYVNEIRTELSLWLKATKLALSSDFSALALSIEKNLENTNPIAIDLIQAVRALSMSAKQSSPEGDLKREENLLQMFNSGVCDHFLTILGNINSHHQQPDLQTATFLGPSGVLLVSIINNIVVILREILNIRIASHGSGFKDTSLLTPLMRIYALLSVVPERALCKHLAVKASRFVVQTLGIFTANLENSENSSVGTSIWTTLLKDLFSFSIESANVYLPGLDMLSHLLPCSLPVALRQALPNDSEDQDRLNNAKKIWSVHLLLAESDFMAWAKHVMMCYQMVSSKLTEVLAQLIELSPAIVQLLTAAYIELVLELVEDREWSVLALVMALGARLSALVKFKVALSRLLLEDKGKMLLERLQDLTLSKTLNLTVLTQYVEMIQNLCDENCGFYPLPNETRDDMLASLQARLPPQSVLLEFILYLWHLMSNETHMELHVPALDTLRVICRHDFGFALVQHCLTKILVAPCLSVVKSVSGPGDLAKSKMNTLLAFLDLVTTLPTDGTDQHLVYKRTKHFKDVHLRKLFGGSAEEASDAIRKAKSALTLEDNQDLKESSNDTNELLKRLDELDHSVRSWGDGSDLNGEIDNPIANLEPSLPTLSELFANAKKSSLEKAIPLMNPDGKALSTPSVVETLDLIEVTEAALCKEFDLAEELKKVCYEKSLATNTDTKVVKKSEIERKALHNKSLISNFKTGGQISIRGRVYNRLGSRPDGFRSRPANTSRPPSLHVDDFLVLQQRGQQPTGPTGYNKQSLLAAKELFAEREAQHAKSSVPGFREATKEPVYDGGRPGGAGGGGGGSGGVGRRGGGSGGRANGPNGPGGRGPRPSRGWSPGEGGGDRRQGRRGGGNWSGDRRSSLKERRKLGGRDDRNKIPPRSMNR